MARTPNDRYLQSGWDSPAVSVVAITPADADLADDCRALWIGTAGNVVVTCPDGSTATFACVASQLLPVVTRRVAAATTAGSIVGLL
jgi:hypothetical protein